jgi:uncharacterized protein (TIGR00730 family)
MRRICVFTGSNSGARAAYADAARELGTLLASRGIGLVYGGGRVGLMGTVADAVLAAGGEAIGVIPEALVAKEVAHTSLTRLHVVGSMHERKALMADLADAFLAMPGGWGTLEEFFEVITWAQLGLHRKPCGLLNVEGYFDGLLAFLDHSIRERFVRVENAALLAVAAAPAELLDRLGSMRPPAVEKWLDRASS